MDKMKNIEIIVGSKYFFKGIKGFMPKDIDKVVIIDKPKTFKHQYRINAGCQDTIYVARENKYSMLSYVLNYAPKLAFGRFLVPEFCKEFDITLEDLKILEPMLETIDDKHKYFQVIYDAYKKNNSMTLTEEQRNDAYEVYKKYRKSKIYNLNKFNKLK